MKLFFSVVLLVTLSGILSLSYAQWQKYTIGTNLNNPAVVDVADIDGDNDMDVAATGFGAGDVVWGLYLLDIFDYYVENFGLVLVTLFMMLIMGWVWGGAKILDAANEAGDFKLPSWYKWVVKVVSPVGIIIALAFIFLNGFYAVGSIMEFTAPVIWIAICVVFAAILWRMKGVD